MAFHDLQKRKELIEFKLKRIMPPNNSFMLEAERNRLNQEVFVDTVKLMFDLIEDGSWPDPEHGVGAAIVALEAKVGIDHSQDPTSLDFKIGAIFRRLERLEKAAGV
jgi:hypothetical protein